MFVKPAKSRAVRDPVSRRLLPAEGADVPETSFWHRRVRDEDVIVTKPILVTEIEAEQAAVPAQTEAPKPDGDPASPEHEEH